MKPILNILPPAQLILWPQLKDIPQNFILYGGTAIALQLGHRNSIDFDFFSADSLNRPALINKLPFLEKARLVQPEINTLDCYVNIDDQSVKLQFLCGFGNRLKRVDNHLITEDNGILIASLRDLLANKLNTIQSRAEIKDYIDIDAIIQKTNLSLAEGLGCAQAIFGPSFDPGTSLRALCSYKDGNLPQLTDSVKDRLIELALSVDNIPYIKAISDSI